MNSVVLQIPGHPEYVRVARLAISGTASWAGFTVEQIADIKQSVGEACTNAVLAIQRAGEGRICVEWTVLDDHIDIEVTPVEGFGPESRDNDETSFQYFLIKTLMDSVELTSNGAGQSTIKMSRSLSR